MVIGAWSYNINSAERNKTKLLLCGQGHIISWTAALSVTKSWEQDKTNGCEEWRDKRIQLNKGSVQEKSGSSAITVY